ncbi:APC family permease [Sinosporangium siamense]|uniref:Amino acid permease n=1 Tax=Sinosporangium siamense TaxID=1367973 RepID=A0A919RFB1_9ACTN|nr:APC family permease [Sinosporangium siamense]GII92833.1 amino acid permease [Sinosporangium siamense]
MSETTLPRQDRGLRKGAMSGGEVVAQAIANIAPSAVIAFTVAAIYASAGNASWLSFALATVVILAVGYCISQFAKRRASAGSLYNYAAQGLGPFGAFVTGIALLIGCFGIASGSLGGAVYHFNAFLSSIGITIQNTAWNVALALVIGALAILFTVWGIRLSARVSLILEIVSIAIITIMLFVVLFASGGPVVDDAQLSLSGATPHGVALGMVLGILGFVGFSSADALGREARNPFKAIPRAIMWSAFGVGLLYVFAAYTQVAGYRVLGDLGASGNPLDELAVATGMPGWFRPVLSLGITASFFAVVVAPINVIGRIVFVMGKEGVVSRSLGRTHHNQRTPHRAILAIAPFAVLLTALLLGLGVDGMSIVVNVDTYGTYGYMVAYAVVAVAALIYLRREGVRLPLLWPAVLVSVVGMAYVFYVNVVPWPSWPLNFVVIAFFVTMAVAVAWYAYLKVARPAVTQAIGTTETDFPEMA